MLPQLEQDLPAVPRPPEVEWSLATRIGFRFAFSYFFRDGMPMLARSCGDRVVMNALAMT